MTPAPESPAAPKMPFAKAIPLDDHMFYLVSQYSLTAIMHALVEACYRLAKEQHGSFHKWRNVADRLTQIERCNPETTAWFRPLDVDAD